MRPSPKEKLKYVFVPLIVSGNVRKQVIPRIEEALREELTNSTQFYIMLEADTFHTTGDDITFSVHDGQSLVNYHVRLIYTVLKQNILYKLLKADTSKEKSFKALAKKFATLAYRKYSKLFKSKSEVVTVLWSDENAMVVLDKLDLEKAEIAYPVNEKIIKKLQKTYSWPTICIYDDFNRDLTIYVRKGFKAVKKVRI